MVNSLEKQLVLAEKVSFEIISNASDFLYFSIFVVIFTGQKPFFDRKISTFTDNARMKYFSKKSLALH